LPPWVYGVSLAVGIAIGYIILGRKNKKKNSQPVAKGKKKKIEPPPKKKQQKAVSTSQTKNKAKETAASPTKKKVKENQAAQANKKEKKSGAAAKKETTAALTRKDGINRLILPGYIPDEKLPKSSQRVLEQVMTYREFLLQFPGFEADAGINAAEKVFVVRTSTRNTKGQLLMSTTVYKISPVKLILESAKAE
jgi:hypothetical protein